MLAAVQRHFSGIGAINATVEHVEEPAPGVAGTLIEGAYAPVMPWDITSGQGSFRGRSRPSVIGYAVSGTVANAGLLGARNSIGSRVIAFTPSGSNAQRSVAPLASFVFDIPDSVGFEHAATTIGGGDTALMLSKVADLNSGDRALVAGANGGVGTWLVQLLNLRGVKTDILSSPRSLAVNKKLFPANAVADDIMNLDSDYKASIDLTGSEKVLRVLEDRLVSGGTLVMAATPNRQSGRNDIKAIFRNRPIGPAGYKWLLARLADRSISAVIDSIYPLTQVRDAQSHVKNDIHHGRTLLRLNDMKES